MCLLETTLITTSMGDIPLIKLIDKQFSFYYEGKLYKSTEEGFYSTGKQDLFELKLIDGKNIIAGEKTQFKIFYNNDWILSEIVKLHFRTPIAIIANPLYDSIWNVSQTTILNVSPIFKQLELFD
jgi:hypothetical protein